MKVLEYVIGLPEGAPVCAKELLHLGKRAAVDQTLSRLTRRGQLIRVRRGLYLLPVEGKFGARPPEASKAVEAIAARRGESVARHGAAAANELGLTTQVPVRLVYLTSGRNQAVKLGTQVVEMRHVPGWQLALAGRAAGAAIRALAWLGPEKAVAAIPLLGMKLPVAEREALMSVRGRLPNWMAEQVSRLAMNG